jgi:hypothetical protein
MSKMNLVYSQLVFFVNLLLRFVLITNFMLTIYRFIGITTIIFKLFRLNFVLFTVATLSDFHLFSYSLIVQAF